MPNFNYTAIDGQGNETNGVLAADSNTQAIEMLKGKRVPCPNYRPLWGAYIQPYA